MNKRGKIAIVAAVAILVVVAILLIPVMQNLLAMFFQKRIPTYSEYRVQRDLIVDANGGTVNNFTIDVPVLSDVNRTGQVQFVSNVVYDPAPTFLSKAGLEWAVWEHDVLQGSQRSTVRVTFDLRVEAKVWSCASTESLNISDLPAPLVSRYSGDEWMIVVNDPGIQTRAQDIVQGGRNVHHALESIYRWVIGNIHYPQGSADRDSQSSVDTLASKVGDCDDQAMLFCALARASGIPAWVQLGALYSSSGNKWGGHGWVQTYIPLKGGSGEYVTIDTVNREFLIWSPNRYVDYTDDGNGEHLRDYYFSFYCSYEPGTYSIGDGPIYSESYVSLMHHDSSEFIRLVDLNPFQNMAMAEIRRSDTVLA